MIPLPVVLALAFAFLLSGCTTAKYQEPPPLTQEDIISLSKAGKADQEIIQEIKTRRTYYRLSAKDIIYLHDHGVSNGVIDYMLDTYLDAVRDEQRRYDSTYYWSFYNNHWYYSPPSVYIIRKK